MKVDVALNLARALMDAHGLTDWGLELSRGKRTIGTTRIAARKITISRLHIEHNGWPAVRETVLHEIAHALVFEEHGAEVQPHGPEWQRTARRVGCEEIGGRTQRATVPPSKWVGTCPCGANHEKDRLAKGAMYLCNSCNRRVEWRDRKTGRLHE